MVTFEQLWSALYEHGTSRKSKDATKNTWDSLSPEQQEWVFNSITAKLAERGFVQFDPIRAIKEHLARMPKNQREPTNYRGKAIPAGVQVFSAKYNGTWGMYTQEDIHQFNMQLPES